MSEGTESDTESDTALDQDPETDPEMDADLDPSTAAEPDSEPAAGGTSEPVARSAAERWRSGRIGVPAMFAVLVLLGGLGLAAASVGGWGAVALLVVLIVASLSLITSWAVTS